MQEKNTIIIGHRGCPHCEPENTLKSFKKAIDDGAEMIELDVRTTKDKQLIVMHDSNLLRTTGIDKQIKSMTLKDIRKHTTQGETIPTLKETIEFLKGKCMMNIESKDASAAESIIKIINKTKTIEDVILASRSWRFLMKVKITNPFIKTSWIFSRPRVAYILRAKLMGVYSLQPHITFATRRMIKRAQKNNLKVFVWWNAYPIWEVNMKRINSLKPDGIITHDTSMKLK